MSSASRAEPRTGDPVVLVVEDEPVLRASIVRGLAKLPGVEVMDAGTVRDARSLIGAYPPRLVICDLDLPDGSGIEVATELDRRGLRVPIAFVSAFVHEFRPRLPSRSGIDVLEKPVSLDRLRGLVETHLGREAVEPSSPFGVTDYVQLAGLGRRSAVIEVRGNGGMNGTIVVRAGEIWSAHDERGRGMDAFRRLAFARDVDVRCRALAHDEATERNIEGLAEGVLLEAARQLDESAHAQPEIEIDEWEELDDDWTAPPKPDERVASRIQPRTELRGFEDLYEEAVDALLSKRFADAYRAFVAASRVREHDPRVVANLVRLREMGYGA